MQDWGIFLLVIGVLIANVPAVVQQWRTDRPGLIKTLWLILAYAVYVAAGMAGLFLLLGDAPQDNAERAALLLSGAVTAWILYGGLLLVRLVPRYREPPHWLMRFGIADLLVLGLLFGCLAGYVWS
ncbi:MAG: hypothetical protein ACRECX_05045 [Methyloceanibacter sp.]|uniref:hypothetical protein n=1 Tax=Methyloceanibacter sp. TaxID=1965321 RepID=UPI003D6C8A4A